jgi:hypothetical protein
MTANSQMGNVISRLQGLKNVSGRRVMPGNYAEELENESAPYQVEEEKLPRLPQEPEPAQNTPTMERGGSVTPQSYDVRANTVEQPPEQEGMFSRLGRGLRESFTPKISPEVQARIDEQRAMEEQVPSEEPALQQEEPNVFSRLGQWFKESNTPSISPETKQKSEALANQPSAFSLTPKFKEHFPEVYKNNPAVREKIDQAAQLDQEALDRAMENPNTTVAYGATNEVANSPELIREFEEYTGINFDKQMQSTTAKFEKLLDDRQKGITSNEQMYDEQQKRINDRINENKATDSDKFYIGLALAMPLIVGGIFGKEAGIGALAGTAEGFGNVFKRRDQGIREDEAQLAKINQNRSHNQFEQGKLDLERIKIPSTVKDQMPEDEYKDLKGMNLVEYKDPKTGKVVASGAEILPDLELDLKYGNNEKSRTDSRKNAHELSIEKAALEGANKATSNIAKAALQLKDSGVLSKILAYGLSNDDNGALKKTIRQTAPDIVIDGRKVNSAVYLDSQLEIVKEAARRNEGLKAYTQTVASHFGNMADNPQYSGLKPQDLIDQMLVLRDRGQNSLLERAAGQGFLKQPLISKFAKANKELFGELNRKEDQKELQKAKDELLKSE